MENYEGNPPERYFDGAGVPKKTVIENGASQLSDMTAEYLAQHPIPKPPVLPDMAKS